MTSFLDKLNEKLGTKTKPSLSSHQAFVSFMKDTKVSGAVPLPPSPATPVAVDVDEAIQKKQAPIDISQSPTEVIVYMQAAGVEPKDFDIALTLESDTLTVQATKSRPTGWRFAVAKLLPAPSQKTEEKFIVQECTWDKMYRKITLPVEVDLTEARAFFEHGTLILFLPIVKPGQAKKLPVVDIVNSAHSS